MSKQTIKAIIKILLWSRTLRTSSSYIYTIEDLSAYKRCFFSLPFLPGLPSQRNRTTWKEWSSAPSWSWRSKQHDPRSAGSLYAPHCTAAWLLRHGFAGRAMIKLNMDNILDERSHWCNSFVTCNLNYYHDVLHITCMFTWNSSSFKTHSSLLFKN